MVMALSVLSCNNGQIDLDVEGHRGCRGLMPENTLPAFEKAVELGVNTLELDVVVTKDKQVVVSHEAWFDHNFCLDPTGNPISESEERNHNIYQMTYEEVKKYDCGSKPYPNFPDQQKMKVHKPLLSEVFEAIEMKTKSPREFVQYNIELKVEEGQDGVFNPAPKDFVQLVLPLLYEHEVANRCIIQSFDVRILQAVQEADQDIKVSLLIDSEEDYKSKLSDLGFYPKVISPDFNLVNEEMLGFAGTKFMKVVPWTVNEKADMERLILMGVNGIITDYPDRLLELLQKL